MKFLFVLCRNVNLKVFAVFVGILMLSPSLWPDKFETHDLAGTGFGFTNPIPNEYFAYQVCHGAIQTADIDNGTWMDFVVLADTSDIGLTENVNVERGKTGDPNSFVYVGSDLVWYKNNSFGGFFPQRVTIEVLGIETPATIFNGKRLEVADLDKDGDQDIVVWCNYNNQSVEAQNLGAGRVAWFENRTIVNPGPTSELFIDGRPKFIQHDVVVMQETFTVDGTTFKTGNPRAGTLADMDNDTWIDLIVSNYSGTNSDNSSLFWFKNTGLGGALTFDRNSGNVVPIIVQGSLKPYKERNGITVTATDINDDGNMDIVLGENGSMGSDKELTLLMNRGGGVFEKFVVKSDFRVWQSLYVQDLFVSVPGNTCQEIISGSRIFSPTWNSPPSVFYATDVACTTWMQEQLPNTADFNHIWDIRVGDVNNDGLPDILAFWANDSGNPATVTPSLRRSMCPIWINNGTAFPSDWTTVYLEERQEPPGMETENNGGLAIGDFDKDGDLDVVRSHVETNLAYFENTWNTERFYQIDATADRFGTKQRVTSILSTNPNRTAGQLLGQKVESK